LNFVFIVIVDLIDFKLQGQKPRKDKDLQRK